MASTEEAMTHFETGATRNESTEKLDIEGFVSPVVIRRYAQFMHRNRKLPDGTLRNSDNWQLGIPTTAYVKSLTRHVNDLQLHHDGFGGLAIESLEDSLCAIIFNASGYLFEIEKKKYEALSDRKSA